MSPYPFSPKKSYRTTGSIASKRSNRYANGRRRGRISIWDGGTLRVRFPSDIQRHQDVEETRRPRTIELHDRTVNHECF
ncbi:hypothetical protein TNCV_2159011 [Trichonephila clavipes]|nr:hypothetical protein TNCV_2159011 [Trichonephila clavipes]